MLKLKTEGTPEEQAILIEAICYRFNYSDTKTIRTEVITPLEIYEDNPHLDLALELPIIEAKEL